MIELPEAVTLTDQLIEALGGRTVARAEAGRTPHGFAWYSGDPAAYADRLAGREILGGTSCGGFVQLATDGPTLVLGEGACPRLLPPGAPEPARHQLLITFDDDTRLVATVRMYGCLWLTEPADTPSPYLQAASAAPSPLTDAFDADHWARLLDGADDLVLKACLATKQRIPGLGNGVLQDILWTAGLHPRRTVGSLDAAERAQLHETVRSVLTEMTRLGGRSTERDAHGRPGGYPVVMQRAALDRPCPRCGGIVRRATLLGGRVYTCDDCQR